MFEHIGGNAEFLISHERFAAELEEDALVFQGHKKGIGK